MRAPHQENARSPMLAAPPEKVTRVRPEQLANAHSPTDVTLPGIEISVRLLYPSKAELPIPVTPSSISTVLTCHKLGGSASPLERSGTAPLPEMVSVSVASS